MAEGQRIFSLISSVMGSVATIASGNISAAVAGVETSLAKSIPVALSFLSKIFKVSGIGTKVKALINKVKGRIDKVVSRVMDKAAELVAKVVGKGTDLANTAKDKGKAILNKIKDGVFGKKTFKAGKGQHSVWVKVTGGKPELWIASTPREANAQLTALTQEATQRGVLPLVQPSINQAQGKINNAIRTLNKQVRDGKITLAPGQTSSDAEMSKHSTEVVNGVEHSVKDIFDQLDGGTPSANLKLNLSFTQLRREFFSSGRPEFSSTTKTALGTLTDTEDRRHTQAFDDIFKNSVAQINGKTYQQAQAWLAGQGFNPSSLELQEVKGKLKAYLHKEFNRLENLWVGEKRENQQKGSDFGAAERELKGLTPGTPEYQAALARRSAAVVDPAKGTANGKKIGTTEQAWIDQINIVNSRLPSYISAFNAGKLTSRDPDYTDARDDRTTAEINQKRLGDFSKTMNSSEFSVVNITLGTAARSIYELNRILKG